MSEAALRVVVTRPAAQAAAWVEGLRARAVDAVALPLIEIVPAADGAPLVAAWHGLPERSLVVFVSPNAVLHFFAARPTGSTWPASLAAAAPGAGTAQALRDAGIDAAAIVAPASDARQFDSESLWQRLRDRDWTGARVLVVRGGGGRDWLTERLLEARASVDRIDAYARAVPSLDADGRAALDALVRADDVAWLFSSSQAIGHLEQLAGSGRWAAARAIASHPRIASRARQAGFGCVVEAGSGLDAVVACLQSMRP
ncbi:MAG TPA: uroporphyrinogen-III synthase [Caldimonas sp.]|nr:uroporphyrinogen-III synthase [Caldimonas sp.]HEX2541095.1 uroporphyrinogen-III synthase [Caldimonas sp.]